MMQNNISPYNSKLTIGIVGGSGAGKSKVCEILEGLEVEIINADLIGHNALLKEYPNSAYHQIIAIFGEEILGEGDEICRKKLGKIVFSNTDALTRLSAITHPFIIKEVQSRIMSSKNRIFAIDAAVLIEMGLHKICRAVLGVFAPIDERVSRIMYRDNIARGAAKNRINSQKSDCFVRQFITHEIHNDSNLGDLNEKVHDFFDNVIRNSNSGGVRGTK